MEFNLIGCAVRNIFKHMHGLSTCRLTFIAALLILGGASRAQSPLVGICASLKNDSLLAANGYTIVEETVSGFLSPRNVSEEQFARNLSTLRSSKLKMVSANVFVPGVLKLVGPNVNEAAVLGYVDTVMRRARETGLKIIVLGSGEARRLPPGTDSAEAAAAFIRLGRKMAEVAGKYGITIAIENLNHTETNFVLSLEQGIAIVRSVNHPSFRLTADIYHMQMEGESPAVIEHAKGLLVNCHIAERNERAYPGKTGMDFRPYFRAMKKIGYSGNIMIECRWGQMNLECGKAKAYLDEQIRESYR